VKLATRDKAVDIAEEFGQKIIRGCEKIKEKKKSKRYLELVYKN
jgi:hypothetical protein